ncbi:MAG: signal peptidase I [Pseudomonadota bacterium]
MTDTDQRQVRPIIAGLLSLISWGLGAYYLGRSALAIKLAGAHLVFGIVLGLGFIALLMNGTSFPLLDNASLKSGSLNLIGLAFSIPLAMWIWRLAARQKTAKRANPVRLFGYAAIWGVPIVLSTIIAFLVRGGLYQPIYVASGAMQPTLSIDQVVIVDKRAYGYGQYTFHPLNGFFPTSRRAENVPNRGDIIVFRPYRDPNYDYIFRLIGMPGDKIDIKEGVVWINDKEVPREFLGSNEFVRFDGTIEKMDLFKETLPNGISYVVADAGEGPLDNVGPYFLPEERYFLMGDNRDRAQDSRVVYAIGYVPHDNLIGKAILPESE